MDSISVSAPTGFRHLKSAAEILREFDAEFVTKQKRPAAMPIGEAQMKLRGSQTTLTEVKPLNLEQVDNSAKSPEKSPRANSGVLSPKLKAFLSPKSRKRAQQDDFMVIERTDAPSSPTQEQKIAQSVQAAPQAGDLVEKLSPKSPQKTARKGIWLEETPKYEAINETVFCIVMDPVEGERDGDLTLAVGTIVAMNAGQDFSEEWWFGAEDNVDGAEAGYFPQAAVDWYRKE